MRGIIRHRGILITVAVLVGISVTAATFYPGYMSPDSVRQLKQARSASYDDWHPPIMALVWGILDSVIPGPVGMLVFHNILFWSGLGLTISLVAPRSLLAPVLVLAVGFFPSVFALLSTIWKDVGMASALLLAFSLLPLRRSPLIRVCVCAKPCLPSLRLCGPA
mgnify:CR=1 FL=1